MARRLNQFDLRGAVSSQIGWNAIEYEKILDDMTRAELIAIMPGILADYRADIEQKKADIVKAMNEAVDKLISLHEEGEWPDMEYLEKLYEEYDNRLKPVFSRLDEVASMSDEDFLDLFKYLRFGYK
jgi:Cdc6-like AAA superfamily ATPase